MSRFPDDPLGDEDRDDSLIVSLARPCTATGTDALFFPASGAMAAPRKAKGERKAGTFPEHDIPLVPYLHSIWVELFKLVFWREFELSSTFTLHVNKFRSLLPTITFESHTETRFAIDRQITSSKRLRLFLSAWLLAQLYQFSIDFRYLATDPVLLSTLALFHFARIVIAAPFVLMTILRRVDRNGPLVNMTRWYALMLTLVCITYVIEFPCVRGQSPTSGVPIYRSIVVILWIPFIVDIAWPIAAAVVSTVIGVYLVVMATPQCSVGWDPFVQNVLIVIPTLLQGVFTGFFMDLTARKVFLLKHILRASDQQTEQEAHDQAQASFFLTFRSSELEGQFTDFMFYRGRRVRFLRNILFLIIYGASGVLDFYSLPSNVYPSVLLVRYAFFCPIALCAVASAKGMHSPWFRRNFRGILLLHDFLYGVSNLTMAGIIRSDPFSDENALYAFYLVSFVRNILQTCTTGYVRGPHALFSVLLQMVYFAASSFYFASISVVVGEAGLYMQIACGIIVCYLLDRAGRSIFTKLATLQKDQMCVFHAVTGNTDEDTEHLLRVLHARRDVTAKFFE